MSSSSKKAVAARDEDVLPAREPRIDATRKFHKQTVKGHDFVVDVRYTGLQYVGGGAYGLVAAAEDTIGNRKVAIKKITDTFRDLTDGKRILRELKLLRALGGHENISWILDIMVWPNRRDFKDVYIVTDLMETDLAKIIASPQTLSDSHIKYFVYQILRGLKFVHTANVLHRDLKPSNLLVNSNCELVICDFGLARGISDDSKDPDELTQYVVTRWYRAPELLTGCQPYDAAIDVWSVGCILAEILGRRPLFPGRNYVHQLQVIIDILGSPSEAQSAFITRKSARSAIRAMGQRRKVSLAGLYPHSNPLAVDLLEKMLQFNPTDRVTINAALEHPYLADYHYPDDEPEAPVKVDLDIERKGTLSQPQLQTLMLFEAEHFHPSNNDKLKNAAKTPAAAAAAAAKAAATPKPGALDGAGGATAAGAGAGVAGAGSGAGGGAEPGAGVPASSGGADASSGAAAAGGLSGSAAFDDAVARAAAAPAAPATNGSGGAEGASAGAEPLYRSSGAAGDAAALSATGSTMVTGTGTTTVAGFGATGDSAAAPRAPDTPLSAAEVQTAVSAAMEKQMGQLWTKLTGMVETQFKSMEASLAHRMETRVEALLTPHEARLHHLEAMLTETVAKQDAMAAAMTPRGTHPAVPSSPAGLPHAAVGPASYAAGPGIAMPPSPAVHASPAAAAAAAYASGFAAGSGGGVGPAPAARVGPSPRHGVPPVPPHAAPAGVSTHTYQPAYSSHQSPRPR